MENINFGNIKNKEILITGGLGLTGNNLARRLVKEKAKVSIISKSLKNKINIEDIIDRVELIRGDISDYNLINKSVYNKDYIFHLAGQSSVPKSMEDPFLDLQLNCRSTLNILESCRRNNNSAKIVFSGTVREAGPLNGRYADGNTRENPTSIFDLHKLTSEKYMKIYTRVYGLKTTTLRFSNVFGDIQYNTDPNVSVLNHFIRKSIIEKKLQVYGDGGPLRDHIYVENVVDALILAAQSDNTSGKHYVLGSGEGNTFFDFLSQLKFILKYDYSLNVIINKVQIPEDVKNTAQGDVVVDYSQLNKDTGWEPRISFEEGLKSTIRFYNNQYSR